MSAAHSDSMRSATISISRCGNDGKWLPGCLVRRDRKFISARAFIVTYIDEYVPTGRTIRATSRATPAASISWYAA